MKENLNYEKILESGLHRREYILLFLCEDISEGI